MIRKLPIVASPIRIGDIFSLSSLSRKELIEAILELAGTKYLYFTNSATSSFYVILEALKKLGSKKEVVLPAYTASSLIYAVKKARLKPVLCDISLDDYNMDKGLLGETLSSDTLCIVCVHMFGIPQRGVLEKKDHPGIFVIEDCAQAMGTKVDDSRVGNLGDISFFSFNRGKNIPSYGGGCIATNHEEISRVLTVVLQEMGIPGKRVSADIAVAFKMLAFSAVVNPWIYGIFYPLISGFKEVPSPEDFKIADYSDFQSKIAYLLLQRIEDFSEKRYSNAMRLIEGLKDIEGILLPKIPKDCRPAFNRLPIVFRDSEKRQEAQKRLCKAGIESSRMYYKPLHHAFELGYGRDKFPNAVYFAEHLLTLPVHPLVKEKDLTKTIETLHR
ncbi:MAG: DegT/DnrJ/EryC1/StrS family aminotransferase [Candidatus Omnitrophota bacterium]